MPHAISLDAHAATALDRAAEVLLAGGTVVLPTDTVYGVAALPGVAGATDRLFALKDRPDRQPLAVLVADVAQAEQLADVASLTPGVRAWMARFWPGGLTLVLPRASVAAAMDLGGSAATIGLRCPDHEFVRELARRVGPVATTSANRHGDPTPPTAGDAAAALTGAVDLVIDGGPAGRVASTVVDATSTAWRVLRAGAVTEAELRS